MSNKSIVSTAAESVAEAVIYVMMAVVLLSGIDEPARTPLPRRQPLQEIRITLIPAAEPVL